MSYIKVQQSEKMYPFKIWIQSETNMKADWIWTD